MSCSVDTRNLVHDSGWRCTPISVSVLWISTQATFISRAKYISKLFNCFWGYNPNTHPHSLRDSSVFDRGLFLVKHKFQISTQRIVVFTEYRMKGLRKLCIRITLHRHKNFPIIKNIFYFFLSTFLLCSTIRDLKKKSLRFDCDLHFLLQLKTAWDSEGDWKAVCAWTHCCAVFTTTTHSPGHTEIRFTKTSCLLARLSFLLLLEVDKASLLVLCSFLYSLVSLETDCLSIMCSHFPDSSASIYGISGAGSDITAYRMLVP